MSITLNSARDIARAHLAQCDSAAAIIEKPATTRDYGWVFCYESVAYLESGRFEDMLFGNAPLLIEKATGRLIELGTAYSIEEYLEVYERFGDPHAVPGAVLEVTEWRRGAQKVAATKAIKLHSHLGLKDAKRVVDDCLEDKVPTVHCQSPEAAASLKEVLWDLGFSARQRPK